MRRVAITGIGALCSTGMDKDSLWENIKAGKHGFVPIQNFDTSDFDIKYAAEIQGWDPVANGIAKKEARRMDLFCQYALAAANHAVEDAGNFAEDLDPYRIGVIAASGIGGFRTFEESHNTFLEKGPDRVSVFFIPMMICNMASGHIAIAHGFKGDNFCPVSACAASTNAIGEAFRKIRYGHLEACIAGGTEATVTKLALSGFNKMTALSRSTDPDRLSIPFDKERDGFAMGDGAAMLVLEEMEHAKRRGAHIYAEVVGYGATDDAYHITSPDPNGAGGAKAMEFAIAEAGIAPEQVDYVNAHGTSTGPNDRCETMAIKTALGEAHARKIAVSSTKSMTGHLLGAAGAIEAAITAMALEEGVVPPTAGYRVPDEECDLDYVTDGARRTDMVYALSNSLGFGGHNATIALKKYQGE